VTETRQKDFTKHRVQNAFVVGTNTYFIRTAMTPKKMMRAQTLLTREDGSALEKLNDALKLVLTKDSYELLRPQLDPTPEEEEADEDFGDNTLDLAQLRDAILWIMEGITGRPLDQSPESATGSETDGSGTSSTAGPSVEVSTPSS
jgi:hypothetical protein